MDKALSTVLIVSALIFGYYFGMSNNQIVSTVTPTLPYVSPTFPIPPKIDENELFDLVQRWRFDNYLQPYTKSDFLCSVAEKRLNDVKSNFSHTGFSWERFCPLGCTLSENLASQFLYESNLLDSWLKSSSHSAILKLNYSHSCLKSDGNNVVQIFGYY